MRPRTACRICIVKLPSANIIQVLRPKHYVKHSSRLTTSSLRNPKKWYPTSSPIVFRSFHVETLLSIRQGLVAGTTALCALYRPVEKRLYVGWVGDSKAMLVSQNRMMQIVNPHKPDNAVSSRHLNSWDDCQPSPSLRLLELNFTVLSLEQNPNRKNEYASKRAAAACSR